ncbi:hypothetical protein [Micromonospora coerulea]|uniref:hypothetical protein n=1 Tax=Micromonospora coerulea TaxID=47856 RepID=UPI00190565CB|nr:hypothetical protein [Micromonospora veneta]
MPPDPTVLAELGRLEPPRGYADDFEAGFDTDQVISALVSRLVADDCLIDALGMSTGAVGNRPGTHLGRSDG